MAGPRQAAGVAAVAGPHQAARAAAAAGPHHQAEGANTIGQLKRMCRKHTSKFWKMTLDDLDSGLPVGTWHIRYIEQGYLFNRKEYCIGCRKKMTTPKGRPVLLT